MITKKEIVEDTIADFRTINKEQKKYLEELTNMLPEDCQELKALKDLNYQQITCLGIFHWAVNDLTRDNENGKGN